MKKQLLCSDCMVLGGADHALAATRTSRRALRRRTTCGSSLRGRYRGLPGSLRRRSTAKLLDMSPALSWPTRSRVSHGTRNFRLLRQDLGPRQITHQTCSGQSRFSYFPERRPILIIFGAAAGEPNTATTATELWKVAHHRAEQRIQAVGAARPVHLRTNGCARILQSIRGPGTSPIGQALFKFRRRSRQ